MHVCVRERERDILGQNGTNDNVITTPPTHLTTPHLPSFPFLPAILTSHLRVTSMVRYFLSSPMSRQLKDKVRKG